MKNYLNNEDFGKIVFEIEKYIADEIRNMFKF